MAFGYTQYPARPSPSAEAVGMALLGRRQQAMSPAAVSAGPMTPEGMASEPARVRMAGAMRTGGPRQMDHGALPDGTSPNAISIAVGEALTRVGGGNQTNPNPFKPRQQSFQQLQALGLSPTEARLLLGTGGA